ncbi:MAG: hypothetical protein ACP5HK_04990 [Acidilobus sp.]
MARRPAGRRGRYTTVSIPTPLFERIRSLIAGTGFTSVSQFVTYVLREVVSDMEKEKVETSISDDEKKEIIERLRSLGYI